uniref:putative nuclease HARBI1 n=1 Tax=Styela clava TaxID=7725 RepID=UPI00193A36E2|nr:putative nuclease HARBI1 [Styela clava]
MNVIDILEMIDSEELGEERQVISRSYLRDVQDPFQLLNENEFTQRYRFSKDSVLILLDIIKNDTGMVVRKHSLPPILQLLTALRFFACGHFQMTDGDLMGMSRHTARRSIHRVATCFAKQKRKFIDFLGQDLSKVKQNFFNVAGFPSVIGAIDCTHVSIQSPEGEDAEVFRNRKGYFSINVQAICDANRVITNIVARWPESTHDSRIFANSIIHDKLERNEVDGYLLGDNGYPCKPYLFTPLLNPTSGKENRYNKAHIHTRARIEQCFGILKQRFRVLQSEMRTRLDNTLTIIVAVACLHNFAMKTNQPLEHDLAIATSDDTEPSQQIQSSQAGHLARANIIDQYF